MIAVPSQLAPSRRQRKSDVTKSRLLDAGLGAFLERGYDATTLSEITTRADLGTGTLYLYFPDKRTLYEAVVRRALSELYTRWSALAGEDDQTAQLLSMVKVAIEYFATHPQESKLFLLDGPPVEGWLVPEVAGVMAGFIDGPQPVLRASLVIGAALAAGRHQVLGGKVKTRGLLDATLAFCAGGLLGGEAREKARGRRPGADASRRRDK